MSIDFYDALGESSQGWWAPSIPKGRFWLPPAARLARDPGMTAQFEVSAEHIAGYGPLMCWLTSADCERSELALEILDGDRPIWSTRCDLGWVPQGLVAQRGAALDAAGAIHQIENEALVARVHYVGALVPGAHALVRPTVLLGRLV